MSEQMERMLQGLSKALDGHKTTSIFACGGTIRPTTETLTFPPTFLFYEDKTGQIHRINFPASEEAVEQLSRNCDQATFGVGSVETLDVEYRSAWKLDSSNFLTSFTPLQGNVLEVVRQLLFPGAISDSSIIAELYKLNVLSFFIEWLIPRYIKGRMTGLNLMLIRPVQRINLDRLWSAFQLLILVVSC